YRQGRARADIVDRLRILPAGCFLGVVDTAHTQRPIDQGSDRAGGDIARQPGADAVIGADVVLAAGRCGSLYAVTEQNVGMSSRLIESRINPARGSLLVEARHLGPLRRVHLDLERALATG